jgi:Plavaka transposase
MLRRITAIERLSQEGTIIRCADGRDRKCFPILAGIMADYEEQALLTGVMSGRQCTTCTVPPSLREDLLQRWPMRTHEGMQEQIAKQRLADLAAQSKTTSGKNANSNKSEEQRQREKEERVHDLENFAWHHPYTNIHSAMMMDMLHQLLKGVVQYLIDWVKCYISETLTKKRKRAEESVMLRETRGLVQLDERFRDVPPYPGLRRFNNFSTVKQWTGVEQRAVSRQLIPVVAPLLTGESAQPILLYARAILDFLTLAQYRSHDEETLRYMELALYQINQLKWVFSRYRTNLKDEKNAGHFNFPKFHSIVHYPEFIRLFGTTDGVDTSHSEAGHKYLVKENFARTNKRDNFQEQIIHHITRQINAEAKNEILLQRHTNIYTDIDKQLEAKVTRPSRPLDLVELGWKGRSDGSARDKIKACYLAERIQIDGLLDALAVFVREMRNKRDGKLTPGHLVNRREEDPSWISNYIVQMHPSMTCWKSEGKDPKDVHRLTEEIVRCSPNWQGKGGDSWRRDFVWVQEYEENGGRPLNGKRVGQLQLIVSVRDHERQVNLKGKCKSAVYTGALIDIFQPLRGGCPHEIHGMVEVQQDVAVRRKRNIGNQRFYAMENILRSAHLIPTKSRTEVEDGSHVVFYVNNYVDWEQYNTLYDADFEKTGRRLADRWYKKLKMPPPHGVPPI